MNSKQETGKKGENLACEYLRQQGFVLLARNYRCKMGEIDIIAAKKGCLHFIEVKTRRSSLYGTPSEAVNREKRRRLINCSFLYLKQYPKYKNCNLQMDVIEIVFTRDFTTITYLANAFIQEGC